MKRFFMLFALLLLLPMQAAAEIMVEGAWVRLPPPVADTAAAYMTIRNRGDKDVEITAIETAIATNPEFHSMDMDGEMMMMKKMEKVIVPAHGGISFDPGGNHLMLIGLTRTLKTGEHLMMTLKTSDGESIMVHAEVKDMRGNKGDDARHSDHMEMDDDMKMDDDMQSHHGMHH